MALLIVTGASAWKRSLSTRTRICASMRELTAVHYLQPVSNARMADAANVYLSSRSSEPAVNLPVTDAANVNLGSQSSEKPAAKKRARFQWTTNRIHRILGWLSVASNFEMYTTNTKVNATNKCLEQTGLGGEGCTQQQLKNKLDTLESRYKTVRQTIDQTGWGVDDACNHGDTLIAGQTVTIEEAVKTMFEFYYEMDEIFGTRVNVNPPYVSETGVQSVRTRGNSGADEEYDSEENWSDEDEIDEDPKLIPAGGRQKPVTGPQAASVNKTIAMAEKEKAKREGKGGLDEVEKQKKEKLESKRKPNAIENIFFAKEEAKKIRHDQRADMQLKRMELQMQQMKNQHEVQMEQLKAQRLMLEIQLAKTSQP